jgi:hypothetical protein
MKPLQVRLDQVTEGAIAAANRILGEELTVLGVESLQYAKAKLFGEIAVAVILNETKEAVEKRIHTTLTMALSAHLKSGLMSTDDLQRICEDLGSSILSASEIYHKEKLVLA